MAVIEMFDNVQNMIQLLQQLKQDPVATLAKKKYKIPPGMTDPNDISQYLLNTNQVSQQQVNEIMAMRNDPIIQKLFGGK